MTGYKYFSFCFTVIKINSQELILTITSHRHRRFVRLFVKYRKRTLNNEAIGVPDQNQKCEIIFIKFYATVAQSKILHDFTKKRK